MKPIYLFLFLFLALSVHGQQSDFSALSFPAQTQSAEYAAIPIELKWEVQDSNETWSEANFPALVSDQPILILRSSFTAETIADSLPLVLSAEGIYGNLSVYLNGQAVAYHPNSSAAFRFSFPTSTLKSENTLVLALKYPEDHKNGFPQFTHIYTEKNYIGIKCSPQIQIHKAQPVTGFSVGLGEITKRAQVLYSYSLDLPKSKYKYRIEVSFPPSTYKRIRFVSAGKRQLKGKFNTNLFNLWSPQNPVQMRADIKIIRHTQDFYSTTYTFGLRKLIQNSNQIELNKSIMQINGINYRNDVSRFLNLDYASTIANDFRKIKKYGFNSVRLPGYLPDRHMLENADSLGLLLFVELPIKRYPRPLFFSDELLENSKKALSSIISLAKNHPSLAAIGIGSEISVQDAAIQKFMLILKDLVPLQSDLLTYVSPIPAQSFPLEKVSDFYMFNTYRSLQSYNTEQIADIDGFLLAGKIGYIQKEPAWLWDADPESQQRVKFLNREFEAFHQKFQFEGGFVESFMDWHMGLPAAYSDLTANPYISHSGLYDTQRRAKHWLFNFSNLWNTKDYELLPVSASHRRTNFFSLTVVLATLIFFTVYRKHRRMNENLRKAIRQPYGFFVEMRERRIIPLFNSFWIGGYAALLLGVILAEMIFYAHNTFLFQEIVATIFGPFGFYSSILQISADPLWITVAMFLILFFYPIFISFILKIIAFLSGEAVRYRQGLAIGLWSGVPLLFILPLSLFGFQILNSGQFETLFLILISLFIIWAHFRIINGIRVLFVTGLGKVLTAMLLSYILPIIILWIVFKPTAYWFEYIELLYQARSLF